MEVWRLASRRHPPLSGEGARRVGGRWNSPGRPAVYASESLALCLGEALVHIPRSLPRDYSAFRIAVPDSEIEALEAGRLKSGWSEDVGYTRAIGDIWLDQLRTAALAVPSAVLPSSTNVLLNPLHPAAASIRVVSEEPFRFDPRFRSATR